MEKKQEVQRPEGMQIQSVNEIGQVIHYPVVFEQPNVVQAAGQPDVTPDTVQARVEAAQAAQQQAVFEADVAREAALGLTPNEPDPLVDADGKPVKSNSRRA